MSEEVRAVLDASAVLAWIFDERGADVVEDVLPVSGISAVNFSEVLYKCQDRGVDPDETEADLAQYGLVLLPFRGDEAREILTVKQAEPPGLKLSLADRCCLATALVRNVPAVMSDNAWELLDLEIQIRAFQ